MGHFKELLEKHDYLILHGALGTELESRGYDVSGKLWSANYLIKQPEVIEKVHESYILSGSDIVTTSTYQATIPALIENGLSQTEAENIIRLTVKLAKTARDNAWAKLSDDERNNRLYPLISGDVGPYAAYLANGSEYTGKYNIDKEALKAFHRPRIALLLDEGVDLLAVETIPNFEEAQAIAEIIMEDYPQVETYFSFTSQDGLSISDGTPIKEVATYCDKIEQILAMGLNCCLPTVYENGLNEFIKVTKKPLVAYPQSGEIYDKETKTWHAPSVKSPSFVDNIKHWHDLGAKLVGGCCRTHPHDIKVLRQGLKETNTNASLCQELKNMNNKKENNIAFTIRRATVDDIPALNNLLAQVLTVHHVARPDLFKATGNKFSDEELTALLKDDTKPVFVYVNDEQKVVAHLFLEIVDIKASNLEPIRNLFIEDLCIDEKSRGQKIGKKLYDFAIEYAKELGCHNLTLDAWYDNVGAYRFYERLGMRPQKTRFEQRFDDKDKYEKKEIAQSIRRATVDDIPALNNLLAQVLSVHHVARPDLFKATGNKFSDEELTALLKDDTKPVFVYVNDEQKVVAHLFLEIVDIKASNLEPIRNLFIEDLCVDEKARGQKIGKKLYDFAIEYAKELGCHNLTLDAWYDNVGAYRFYERLGMKPQKTRFEQRLDKKEECKKDTKQSIRRATVDDIPAINNLLAQVLTVHHVARPDLFKATGNKFSDEELATLLKDDTKPVFVYVNDEQKVVAHLFLEIVDIKASNLEPIRNLFIEDLCVDEKARGQKIGKKLYDFAIEYAKELGCHNLTLDAWYDNVGAYRFYERLGMRPQKTRFEQRFDNKDKYEKKEISQSIRRATVDDIPALNNLLAQVLSVHHVARPDLFKATGNKFSDEELAALLKDDTKPVFVYVNDEQKVVGHLFLEIVDIKASNLEPIRNLFIEDLCIDEKARGQRIGKKLQEFATEYAKELGCHNLTLDAWYDNVGAYRFYERLGMKPQKTRFEQRLDKKEECKKDTKQSIRRATVDDIPAINNLLAQVLTVHHVARPDLFKATGNKFSDEELATLLKDDTKPVFVYVNDDQKVVAHLFLEIVDIKASNLEPIRNLFIEDLCVDEKARGQKIGKKLQEFAIEYAKELGCHNLTLDAWYDNVGAYRFYERLGMRPQKTRFEQRFDNKDNYVKKEISQSIRRATVDDIPALNNLLAQVLSVHHVARPDLFKATGNKFSDEELAALLKDDTKPVFVYVNDEQKVVGHLFLEIVDIKASNLEPIRNLFIEDLCIDEKARGQKIGKKLQEFATEYAKELGCHNLTLDAWYDNVGAYRFYERLGMKPQKTRFEQRLDKKEECKKDTKQSIRRATVDDIPAINNLLAQVLTVHHVARPDLFKATGNKFSDEELATLLKDDTKPVFVYVNDDQKVVAHLFLEIVDIKASNLEPIRNLFIEDLCVDEKARGQKIGKKLQEFAIEYAKKLGCHNLTLDAWYDNVGAYRFYERLGMKPQKTRFEQRFDNKDKYEKKEISQSIRRATVDDIPALNNLLAQVLSVHHVARPDLFKATGNKFSDEELTALLKDDTKPVFVYVNDEQKVVGHLFLEIVDIKASNLEPIRNLFIEDLCIDEKARGQKIGKKLQEFATEYAKELGCHNLTLDAWYDNVGAYRFYERLGMKPQKTRFEQLL